MTVLKVHIWMNFPSHHQSGLFRSLMAIGVELRVTYYEAVSQDRVALGWNGNPQLEPWEFSLASMKVSATQRLLELRDFIHVIPGYGSPLLRELSAVASREGIRWCHWSEAARPGWRWWLRCPTRFRYARRVNQFAIGAFAQGVLARRDFMRWGIRPDKIADLNYSISPDQPHVEPDRRITTFADGRGVFLFVGRMDSGKAVDILLRGFDALGCDDWCLVLVGGGNRTRYERMAKELNLEKRVLFLPAVNWTQINEIHAAGDVLVLPSRYEGWGVVANEAAAQSKALILSTACGAAWHLIEPGINGFLVSAGSVKSLAQALRFYVGGGRALAQQHGLESFRIGAAYDCDSAARRMTKVLYSWLAGKG